MTNYYQFDPAQRIWVKPSIGTLSYSDGDEIEEYISSIISTAKDVSTSSQELASAIKDWPSEYHLSPVRHNLLRPFTFGSADIILELGCGCGAMTRYLGETGARVIAVEGSRRRAAIAAERCRDLPNVSVYCDNLMEFVIEQRFDFVMLIGVLEYAPLYVGAANPIAACLKQAGLFLKPVGILVIAIENQLGLKYFNGCDEDHLSTPYYGLQGLYRDVEPTTFGRTALEKKLTKAGLPHCLFYYPFPDYKLPQVIMSDAALTAPVFDAAALLSGMVSSNAGGEFHPNFHENLAWRPIIENSLLPHLANSFLILAAGDQESLGKFEANWLASVYTTTRISAFATETRFTCSGNAILVEKRRLYADLSAPKIGLSGSNVVQRVNTASPYIAGHPYLLELQQRLGRGEGIAGVIEWAASWLDLLLANTEEGVNGLALPGEWVDAIPQNFISEASGKLWRIDDEWACDDPVPLSWMTIRGLVTALEISPISDGMRGLSLRDMVTKIAASKGIHLAEPEFDSFLETESKLRSVVYDCSMEESVQRFTSALGQYPACHLIPVSSKGHHSHVVAELTGEISRIKSTVSWQITKPLRLLAFIFRRLHLTLGNGR
jgi:SAM-dependent methyltransferase